MCGAGLSRGTGILEDTFDTPAPVPACSAAQHPYQSARFFVFVACVVVVVVVVRCCFRGIYDITFLVFGGFHDK